MSAKVYSMGNLKGGVAKTTLTTMLAYQATVFNGEKTLVIDMDPSPGATKLLAKTGGIDEISKSITDGFIDGSLVDQVMPIMENLDLIPGDESFGDLTRLLERLFPGEWYDQFNYLNTLLEPLRDQYDRIFIDLPPSQHDYHRNAIMAADYCIIPLQMMIPSLDAADQYLSFIDDLAHEYDINIQLLGVAAVATAKDSKEELFALEEASKMYGPNLFDTVIYYKERIKAYAREGISHPNDGVFPIDKKWNKDAHSPFESLWKEALKREEYFESIKEGGAING